MKIKEMIKREQEHIKFLEDVQAVSLALEKNKNDKQVFAQLIQLLSTAASKSDAKWLQTLEFSFPETFPELLLKGYNVVVYRDHSQISTIDFILDYAAKHPETDYAYKLFSPSERFHKFMGYISDVTTRLPNSSHKNLYTILKKHPELLSNDPVYTSNYMFFLCDTVCESSDGKLHRFSELYLEDILLSMDPNMITQSMIDQCLSGTGSGGAICLSKFLLNNPQFVNEDSFISSLALAQEKGLDVSYAKQLIKMKPELKKYECLLNIREYPRKSFRLIANPKLILDDAKSKDHDILKQAFDTIAHEKLKGFNSDPLFLKRFHSALPLDYFDKKENQQLIYNEFCELRETIIAENTPAKPKKKSDGKDDLG